ncbi:MAG: L,D-transpeptidase family protein [Gaiellaceae bacterium]
MTEETARIDAAPPLDWTAARSRRHASSWLMLGFRILAALGVAFLGVGAALLSQTRISLRLDARSLAQLEQGRLAGRLVRVTATGPGGRPIPVRIQHGRILPRERMATGASMVVTALVRRPRTFAWLLGREETLRLSMVTPAARLRQGWLHVKPGAPVRLAFDHSVVKAVVVAGGKARELHFARPRHSVTLGDWASDASGAGSATVAAAPLAWERLPRAEQVSWFPRGVTPRVLVTPAPGRLTPASRMTLDFSRTTASLLGDRMPRFSPAVPGRWLETSPHSLAFVPSGLGFPLGTSVRLLLPRPVPIGLARASAKTGLSWSVPPGSTLRLQQLLARLGYLPLSWTPRRPAPETLASEARRATSPPPGRFSWRYKRVPASMKQLWQPGESTLLTTGALMSFEDAHGMAADGEASPAVWRALLQDAVAGRRHRGGYSYVIVHQSVPQRLVLWHDGRVVMSAAANTGIAAAPTAPGTFPVYLRYRSATMAGTNPDGTHYNDPGVPWISYFNGGDAIHGFLRGSYGLPQSLGCIELSFSDAQRVWPYTPIGTLVNVTS